MILPDKFGLIVVLNFELSIWTVWEESFFIVDLYVYIKSFFVKFDKILV